jgi:hypothetical protein
VDYDAMRSFQFNEENGYLPDDVYTHSSEDADDPDHDEIAALVIEQYAINNANRREARMADEIAGLRALLTANDVEIPDDF